MTLTSKEFVRVQNLIGLSGPYQDYFISFDEENGSFVNFRDRPLFLINKLMGKKQVFETDIKNAILKGVNNNTWQGPSWKCFYHAAFNKRPVALITARGHQVNTLKNGIRTMVDLGALPWEPEYLALYPVNHPQVREELGDKELRKGVPELKQLALRKSVEKAILDFGYSPYHRFGMSDDDPDNLEWIFKEMKSLKSQYPELSFFVIETVNGLFIKHELTHNMNEESKVLKADKNNLVFP